MAAGCTAYLTKPIKQDVLLQAILGLEIIAHTASPDNGETAIIIHPDPILADLVPVFLRHCDENLTVMRDALGIADFETVRDIAHSIRGAGGSYGFQRLTDIGAALELAADQRDLGASTQLIDNISRYLRRVQVVPA